MRHREGADEGQLTAGASSTADRTDAGLGSIARQSIAAVRGDPAFALYLLALATLGLKWLSPIEWLNERGIWSDVLIAAAATAWLIGRVRSRTVVRPRLFHLALGLYVAAGVVSMAFALDQALAARTVLLMVELAVLAALTSSFASDAGRLNAIVLTVVGVSLYTAVLGLVALALFYAGARTSLLAVYGEQFIPSNSYARVAAGFQSAPLLGSFAIFASAVLARPDADFLPFRLRRLTQVLLAVLVLATLSRAVIGFAVAIAVRNVARPHTSATVRRAGLAFVVAAIAMMAVLTIGRLELDPTQPSSISYEVPDPGNRREAFATSLGALGERPVFGEGPGALTGENRGQPFRAHMTPLNIAATMGLPALGAIAFLIWVLWRNRRRPTPVATWSGIAGLGVDGLGQDIDHFRHVWVMFGLADADRASSADRNARGVDR
jgi:hypothetical protein